MRRQGWGWVLWEPGVSTSPWCWWVCGGEAGGELCPQRPVLFQAAAELGSILSLGMTSPFSSESVTPRGTQSRQVRMNRGPIGGLLVRELPAQLDFVLYKSRILLIKSKLPNKEREKYGGNGSCRFYLLKNR